MYNDKPHDTENDSQSQAEPLPADLSGRMKATNRQRIELSRLAERNAASHAYPASAWDNYDEAEQILRRTPGWRLYRARLDKHPE